jgi:photosystem II stability/assembly factor-like uncharacterized protein
MESASCYTSARPFSETHMPLRRLATALLLPAALSAQTVTTTAAGTTQLLQAVSAVDSLVVWMTGHGGTVLRSVDGGRTWQSRPVPGADALEFRDVHATSADLAWVLSAGPGDRSRIYHTRDGGTTWALQFRNADSTAFYDCFAFFTPRRGIAFSDASHQRTNLLTTSDGGATWSLLLPDAVPAPLEGEGAFAASGGCVTAFGERHAWVATGGPGARLFRTENGGATWSVHETPMVRGPSAGMTAAHFKDADHGMAVGGRIDAYATDTASAAVAVTQDGGRTWVLRSRPGRAGALFAVTWLPVVGAEAALASGPGGLFLTHDSGRTWTTLDERAFWSVAASGRTAWAGGPRGTAVRIEF